MCGKKKEIMGPNDVLFNPYEEDDELIQSWMQYRHVTPDIDQREAVINDMLLNKNQPPFSEFREFAPDRVSKDFLRAWLSWFGIGLSPTDPLEKWQALCRRVIELETSTEAPTFSRLVHAQKMRRGAREIISSIDALLQRLSEKESAVLRDGPGPIKPNTNVALGYGLAASFILTPLVVNVIRNPQGFKIQHFTKLLPLVGTSIGVGWLVNKLGLKNVGFYQNLATASIQDLTSGNYFPTNAANALIAEWASSLPAPHSVTNRVALQSIVNSAS